MRRTISLLAAMALTMLVANGVALAREVGSASAESSVVGPGESIQKATSAAHPGDTIVVRGVHRERANSSVQLGRFLWKGFA